MKKIMFLLAVVTFTAMSVHAFVDNQYMTTAQYMQNTGYSAEMHRMMSVTNQDPYREPYVESTDAKAIAKRIYNYIVPGEYDNLDFYNHSTNFDHTGWKDL